MNNIGKIANNGDSGTVSEGDSLSEGEAFEVVELLR